MIVRNEERNLRECLPLVAGLFDEIVIVDTGSSDATREVALQHTPHVHDFPWCDDFAAARNETLRHATGDWVMWLDADDRLRPAELAKLAARLDALGDDSQLFLMDTVSRSHYECEGEWRVTHRRLFRRLAGLSWKGRVHEQLIIAPGSPPCESIPSDIEIEHVGYLDLAAVRRTMQRNIRLLQMDYAVDPTDSSTLFHLGITYSRVGTYAEARKYLLEVIRTHNGDLDLLRRVFGALAELSINQSEFGEAEEMARRGLAFFPNDEYLLYLLSQVLYEVHRYDEARATLEQTMFRSTARLPLAGGPGHIRSKLAPRKLGAVLRMQGNFPAAEAALQLLLHQYPDDTHGWYLLGLVYLDTGDGAKLVEVVNRLAPCPQGPIYGAMLQAAWHLRQNQLVEARPLIDRLVAEIPEWPLPRLLRAEWLARCGASPDDQKRALHDLLRVRPGNRYALVRLQALSQPPAAPAWAPTAPAANEWGTSVIVTAG
jgi:glycosyltransferase involved in cell wall biosynthesis